MNQNFFRQKFSIRTLLTYSLYYAYVPFVARVLFTVIGLSVMFPVFIATQTLYTVLDNNSHSLTQTK